MQNQYPAKCHFCYQPVAPHEGVVVKTPTGFKVQHIGYNRAHHTTKGKT